MLAVDTSGVEAYANWLEVEAQRLRLEVRQTFRKWALAIHAEITELTPQWSGNLASNWALDIGSPSYEPVYLVGPAEDTPYSEGPRGGGPMFSRGMEPAVGISLARAAGLPLPKLSDSLFIHNPVAYAQAVEDDTSDPPIRPINRYPRSEAGKVAMVYHAYMKHTINGQGLVNEL